MIDIVVFIGSTLKQSEAKRILPAAYYMPPAQCGDILQITRLNPRIIVLIDGRFENCAAPWHKEILFALEKGMIVIGASSMGALRARELNSFGMLGTGEIVDAYSKTLIDDDEVAVLHDCEAEFDSSTVAMVNIRASIRLSMRQGIIEQETAMILENAAKKLFFTTRTLSTILKKSLEDGANTNQVKIFHDWIRKYNWLDIKKQDAIELLRAISNNQIPLELATKHNKDRLNRSSFFRALHKKVMCRPLTSYQSWLPIQEKVALAARYLGTTYRQTRRLAYLLAACYALAQKENITFSYDEIENFFKESHDELSIPVFAENWLEDNDCAIEERQDMLVRFGYIKKLYVTLQNNSHTKKFYTEYLISLMQLSITKEYTTYKKLASDLPKKEDTASAILQIFFKKEPVKYRIFSLVACLWWIIEQHALRLNLIPNPTSTQDYSNKFRYKHKALSVDDINLWLTENDLDESGYLHLMTSSIRLNYLVLQNNLDALGIIDTEENVFWLLDALRLSGVYSEAKLLVRNHNKIKEIQSEYERNYASLDTLAFDLDFAGGESDFLQDISIMGQETIE